jgi:hypothetical protein
VSFFCGLGLLALRDGFDSREHIRSGHNIWNHLSVDELSSYFEVIPYPQNIPEELKKVILNSKRVIPT